MKRKVVKKYTRGIGVLGIPCTVNDGVIIVKLETRRENTLKSRYSNIYKLSNLLLIITFL